MVFPLNWKMEIRIGIYYVLFPIKIKFCQDMQILLIVKRSLRFNNQTIMFQWIIYFNFMTLFDKNNECSFLLINHNSFISMKTKLWYDIITMMENTKKKKTLFLVLVRIEISLFSSPSAIWDDIVHNFEI